jgi:hypothetical protein
MKVLSVMRAESVRAIRIVGGDYGYLPEAAALFAKQYGFIGTPTAGEIAAAEPAKGIIFRNGKLETSDRLIPVDLFQLFPNGLSVVTHSNTTDSDLVLDHITDWGKLTFKLEIEPLKKGIGHSSSLEVRLQRPLPALFPVLSEISAAITKGLDDWWEIKPAYELININFLHDKSKYPQFGPTAFRLDRRDNVPYEQEVYYSEAPMSTDNHIAVLERLERVCLDALEKEI